MNIGRIRDVAKFQYLWQIVLPNNQDTIIPQGCSMPARGDLLQYLKEYPNNKWSVWQRMQYWLMKSEPGEYSFEDLLRDGQTKWDGVRNFQARNNMKLMKKGDPVLIYHSVSDKQVVGIAEVSREHYPDPVDNPKGQWVLVDIKPVRKLKKPVDLATVKETPELADIALVRQARLSVMPLSKAEFETLVKLGGG